MGPLTQVTLSQVYSPRLFSLYVDDLSLLLCKQNIGCFIDNVCVNHVFYADDICLLAPSAAGIQQLINIAKSMELNMIFYLILLNPNVSQFYPVDTILIFQQSR